MANLERKPGESENDFRGRQKRAEVNEILAEAPATEDEFVASPLWQLNNSKPPNLVFKSKQRMTIFPKAGGVTWIISGGQPTRSLDVFADDEAAKRDL